MLDADDIMDEKLLRRVMHTGHSRIPVYGEAKQNILGGRLSQRKEGGGGGSW